MGQHFSKARDLHHHSTRGKHYNCVVPNVNGMTSTTFYFNAIKDWNSLPIPLKSTCFLFLMNVQKSALVFKTPYI